MLLPALWALLELWLAVAPVQGTARLAICSEFSFVRMKREWLWQCDIEGLHSFGVFKAHVPF